MGKGRSGRTVGAALAAAGCWVLVGCATTVTGVAVKAADRADADGVIVALLDTGDYATSASPPFGPAGDAVGGANMEGHRLAVNVVGPWQVDATFWQHGSLENTTTTAPLPNAKTLATDNVLSDPLPAIAAAHGFITGFSSFRAANAQMILLNAVLRFPDNGSAEAAAREMAAQYPYGDTRPRPSPIDGHPEAISTTYDAANGAVVGASFTPHGTYVLFEAAQILDRNEAARAPVLMRLTLDQQEPLIDRFTATDPAKLTDLPRDFTGQLLARTLPAPDNSAPFMVGVWEPSAWLHFEDNPVTAAPLFESAGVDAVAQRITTVYRARDAAGAAQLVDRFAADMRAKKGVSPITGINGLPGAQCFAWPKAPQLLDERNPPLSWQRVVWPYKCIARAGRYAFTAFSEHENDVKQQIGAQYRILAGK